MKMVQFNSTKINKRSPTQTVARRHLKLHLKRVRDREYARLRDMVPSIASKDKVSKVTVIEEAVKYIDELHRALIERLNSKGLQDGLINETNVKDFVHNMMPQTFFKKDESASCFEKQQKVPSFLLQRKGPKSF
ncbi:uncharacterized protein LOC117336093 [Pecten maximus]|uniref:uncharacterized protein LOC117336093 n=1 Tax=Pecten maximus TaxID=6579 RepID=UPI00145911D3|nr:uncharacterized protein LOC117336093 [Pecten maximus]